MSDGFGSDVLNNPEKYTLIGNAEQLMDVYGDHFEEGKLYRTDVYLEKDLYTKDHRPDSRFMATSAGLVTLRGENVWNQNINDQEFLEGVQRTTIDIKRQVEDNEEPSFDKDVTIHDSQINVTYEPYTVDTTDYVMRELDEREKLLQKRD